MGTCGSRLEEQCVNNVWQAPNGWGRYEYEKYRFTRTAGDDNVTRPAERRGSGNDRLTRGTGPLHNLDVRVYARVLIGKVKTLGSARSGDARGITPFPGGE